MNTINTRKSKRFVPTLLAALMCSASTLALSADYPERIASEQPQSRPRCREDGPPAA